MSSMSSVQATKDKTPEEGGKPASSPGFASHPDTTLWDGNEQLSEVASKTTSAVDTLLSSVDRSTEDRIKDLNSTKESFNGRIDSLGPGSAEFPRIFSHGSLYSLNDMLASTDAAINRQEAVKEMTKAIKSHSEKMYAAPDLPTLIASSTEMLQSFKELEGQLSWMNKPSVKGGQEFWQDMQGSLAEIESGVKEWHRLASEYLAVSTDAEE